MDRSQNIPRLVWAKREAVYRDRIRRLGQITSPFFFPCPNAAKYDLPIQGNYALIGNPGKIREYRKITARIFWELLPLVPG